MVLVTRDEPTLGFGRTMIFSQWGRWLFGCCIVAIGSALTACGGGPSETFAVQSASASAQVISAASNKVALAANPAATLPPPPGTGWYWNPAEGGTGFMFEAQGNKAFVGFFLYEDRTNKPIWYVSYGDVSLGGDGRYVFAGDLRVYHRGQTLTSFNYFSPTSTSVGEVQVSFDGHGATAVLPGGRVMAATRFDIAGSGYDFDHPVPTTRQQPEVGWYWNPDRPGYGFAIEVQNNRVFLGMFHYNEDGTPTWNVVDTDLATGVGSGSLKRYTGGQTLTSAYREASGADLGRFNLSFQNACRGLMQFEAFRVDSIKRFMLDGSGLPPGSECRAERDDLFPMVNGLTAQPARLQLGVTTFGELRAAGDVHVYAVTLPAAVYSGRTFELTG